MVEKMSWLDKKYKKKNCLPPAEFKSINSVFVSIPYCIPHCIHAVKPLMLNKHLFIY